LRHQVAVTRSGARRSTSQAKARAARRISANPTAAPSGPRRAGPCRRRSWAHPAAADSPSNSRTTRATRRTVPNPQAGPGSRSMRHPSGRSVSACPEFHGWNSTVDICTAQITPASSVTYSSPAFCDEAEQRKTASSPGRPGSPPSPAAGPSSSRACPPGPAGRPLPPGPGPGSAPSAIRRPRRRRTGT